MDLVLDFETRSECNLKQHGMFVYWNHSTTIPFCLSLKVNDERPVYWVDNYFQSKFNPANIPNQQIDFLQVQNLIKKADRLIAQNSMFEYLGLNIYMINNYGFQKTPLEKFYDTMAQLGYHALPLNLEQGGMALNLPIQKDGKGYATMMKLTKPRKPRKAERETNPLWESKTYWHEESEDIETIIRYCNNDVDTERLVERSLAPLPEKERRIWLMNERINLRGVPIDTESVSAIVSGVNTYEEKYRARFKKIVKKYPFPDGKLLSSPLYHVGVKNWVIQETGFKLTSIDKDATAALLKREDLPDHVKEVLEIRSQLSKSSVSKLTAFLDRADTDGRVRGAFVYHGSTTGRFASWKPQLHNQVRTCYKPEQYEKVVELYKKGLPEAVELLYDQIYTSASKCTRGSIATTNGKTEFFCTDFSSIEGRGLAYLAKEEWVLEAYRRDEDMYKYAAAELFGCAYAEIGDESKERQVGKVQELFLGYNGGIGAFASGAKTYNIDLETLPPLILPRATQNELEGDYGAKALAKMYISRNPDEMSFEAAVACDVIKRKWREARPMVKQFWKSIDYCAKEAVKNPGQIFEYHGIKYVVHNKFLMCMLPSGRILHYFMPRLSSQETLWGQSQIITYMGVRVVEGKSGRQWTRLPLIITTLIENVVQAFCRDILCDAMLRHEAAGFPLIMHVHDEDMAEVPKGKFSFEEFNRLAEIVPSYALGMPINAKGWVGRRYRK